MIRKLLMITVCLFLFITNRGLTATFNVNNTNDTPDANPGNGVCATATGQCTLRAAVMESIELAGVDTINVPAGLYILSIPGTGENAGATGDLDLDSVTINGTGTVIIDGGFLDRVLDVDAPSIIRGVIVQNGVTTEHGGGIRCNFACTVEDVTVRSNTSGAWGGGIRAQGTLTISNSTISGNTCGAHGGGISNFGGTISASNITISGNFANSDSGGIDNDGSGVLDLINVTIANNFADSNGDGAGNGGGIGVFTGNAFLRNTILANNSDNGGEAPDCSNTIQSIGHNLIRDLSGCTVVGGTADIYGEDPLLSPLGNYGGSTLTHALSLGSPAIDTASNPDCPPQDQRGVTRPQGPVCDMGSYEFDSSILYADNFEDGDASDWTPNKGNWSVIAGRLTGTHFRKADNISPFVGCSSCTVSGYLRIHTSGARASLLAFYESKQNHVEVILMDDKDKVVLKQRYNREVIAKEKVHMDIDPDVDYLVRIIQVPGSYLQVELNGILLFEISDPLLLIGGVGFRVKSTTGTPATASFEEIFVY